MNLKILMLIILYWSSFILIFSSAGSEILTDEGYTINAEFNSSALGINETDRGGLFSVGVRFTRFFGFVLFGVGLPISMPVWAKLLIMVWQTGWTVFTVGFILSSIWNG